MKTLRKACWGIFFLVPLFLPSQTKAGPIDGLRHSSFVDHRQMMGDPLMGDPYDQGPYEFDRTSDLFRTPIFDRSPSFGDRHGQQNDYRPYNPWGSSHDLGGDPGAPNSVPIDGGLVFLLIEIGRAHV